MNAPDVATYALYAAYSSIAVYTIAFIAFALDLAKRSGDIRMTVSAQAKSTQRVATSRGTAGVSVPPVDTAARGADAGTLGPASVFQRVGFSLTLVGFLVHVAAVTLRGMAAGRVPWANMFEFGITGSALIIGTYLLLSRRIDLSYLGSYILGLNLVLLGVAVVNYYVPVGPLAPALQSYWLIVHVFVACLGTAFFAISAGLSAVQLIQTRRGDRPGTSLGFMDTIPGTERLEDLAYRIALVGFILWTFTLIAGAVWAERAWGRYWGWDTKEVWTFIVWVLFAGYIHARATRGWRGTRSAVLALIGFAAVLFNFSVVNLFFKGLHAYSGL